MRTVLFRYFSLVAENAEVLNLDGATILAPVHRSHLDSPLLASLSKRRIRALGKESLFTTPGASWVCSALGAIPVKRGAADREALKAAKMLLDRGESMIVFPEGTRQDSHDVGELFDGAAWLASRTGARVVPIGISGSGEAFGSKAKFPKRRKVGIVVGDAMEAPVGDEGRKASRAELRAFTAQLADRLQQAQDRARDLAAGG